MSDTVMHLVEKDMSEGLLKSAREGVSLKEKDASGFFLVDVMQG